MFLNDIKLQNFRNYKSLGYKFISPITVLVGQNAQGKTNFLESIYLLATTKSLRAEKDDELIKWGEEFLRVEGSLGNEINLEVGMQVQETKLRKRVKVNGVPRRVSDYSENLAVVLFSPEDINLVTGSPGIRRTYIDHTLSQVDRNYKRVISSYERVISRKNKVLKRIREGIGRTDELLYWSEQQITLGKIIHEKRRDFFKFINSVEKKFGNFEYLYNKSELTESRLIDYQPREIAAAASLIGPHRDDFQFLLNSLDLAKYGSRGEQRTSVLDLKLSEVSFFEETLKDRPILLLDDIFSELDLLHREHVLEIANLQQTIIAAVELDNELKHYLSKMVTLLTVDNGKIVKTEKF